MPRHDSETPARRVLVTGGAGFIGSHATERLAAAGWDVTALDNLVTGSRANLQADVPFLPCDIRSRPDATRVLMEGRFDAVVHCAAQTSVERSMKDPTFDREVNVDGTRALVDAAKASGVKRFVFLSSGGAIYGDSEKPAEESSIPGPRSHYGVHKLAAEGTVRAGGLAYAILRPSNVYGARQRSDAEGGVVAIFMEKLRSGQAIEVHGDGRQLRDFVHVSDVTAAIELALDTTEDVTWNVCSGQAASVLDVARAIGRALGREPAIGHGPRRAGDVDTSLLSPAALLATGRWGPPLSLDEGLRLTFAESPAPVIAAPAEA